MYMAEITKLLSSPVWWFTAVIVAIAINLVSAYAKRPLYSALNAGFGWWQRASIKRAKNFDSLVTELAKSAEDRTLMAIYDVRTQVNAALSLLFSVLFLVLPASLEAAGGPTGKDIVISAFSVSAFFFFQFYLLLFHAYRMSRAVWAARRRRES